MMLRAEKVVVNGKSRLFLRAAIGPTHVGQHVKALLLLQIHTYVGHVLSGDDDRHFAISLDDLGHPTGVLGPHRLDIGLELFSHKHLKEPHTYTDALSPDDLAPSESIRI